ncbi:HEPN domain-containing protein [Streptococcus constellatus]|uniref:Apea-like HEPN domain-containing protein n=1 Tax=Streptococcus constellatus TaxID=76860 RepID=A0A0C1K5N0_STRCV|nr:HEPN domain-containing protein [Streptococcus constellatus]KIC78131.1 hypothetical protein RN79_00700 [Streptococcus constellatus]
MLTGTLQMMGYEFFFTFDEEKLSLVPKEEEKDAISHSWFYTKLETGILAWPGKPKFVEEDFLYGRTNETNQVITFLTNKYDQLHENNGIITVPILSYFFSYSDRPMISRMSFSGLELNYIHPINHAFEISYKAEGHDGKINISTYDFDSTTTEKQKFSVFGKEVQVYFGITRTTSLSIEKPPLVLSSSMIFHFEETQDYSFIRELNRIAKEFIQFLCNRRNISFTEIQLSNRQGEIGQFNEIEEDIEIEMKPLKEGRYIQQKYIAGYEGKILNDIAKNNLYLRHLSKSFNDSRIIDAASFVLRTAAFEWEFSRLFSEDELKSEQRKKLEEEASKELERLIENSTGKLKKIYKDLKKSVVSYLSLSQKIDQIFEEYGASLLDLFGQSIYKLNNISYNHSEIAERIGKQRNNFAHGNLDKEFINESLLDVVFLEQIVLAMQLQYFGIDEITTKKIINEVFRHNLTVQSG